MILQDRCPSSPTGKSSCIYISKDGSKRSKGSFIKNTVKRTMHFQHGEHYEKRMDRLARKWGGSPWHAQDCTNTTHAYAWKVYEEW